MYATFFPGTYLLAILTNIMKSIGDRNQMNAIILQYNKALNLNRVICIIFVDILVLHLLF